MLRHTGTKRTNSHNVKLATLLGLTAGFVNAAGFLAFSVLTTNVTGHAALFAERIASGDWKTARVVALWMFLFLFGAFICSVIVSIIGRNQRFSYVIPILIEMAILVCIAVFGSDYNGGLIDKEIYAGSLLFSMGMQNSLVSIVSGSVVRTTHLTGTFTDLGIELGQFLQKDAKDRSVLVSKIKLRSTIILFFMVGALAGAYLFQYYKFLSFWAPVAILIFVLLGDIFRIRIQHYYRMMHQKVR